MVLVIVIVAVVIALQGFFFWKNLKRMQEYRDIFGRPDSWSIIHDKETEFVSGINGYGNSVFIAIKNSINKYLGAHKGSEIDYNLLKDAVDRHCDAVENDINTQTPIPLYCGLAGAMAGIIIGLWSMLSNDAVIALLTGNGSVDNAATGIGDLLEGVAWAMMASICGIVLTTLSSLLFKKRKHEEKMGRNSFLAWLQGRLLPELPSDKTGVLNQLVKNLNRFNQTFAVNTSKLQGAFVQVNESYRIQADVIKAVHDMDVMKMAKANVRVLQELSECTDKLEVFNQYLNDIHGYTDAIHTFTSLFEQEAERLHVLEEIRDYFIKNREVMAKDMADADNELKGALVEIQESASDGASQLNSILVEQAEQFKKILEEEKESFEKLNAEMKSSFQNQLSQLPNIEKQLSQISEIPGRLDRLIERVEKSNSSLAGKVSATMSKTVEELTPWSSGDNNRPGLESDFPNWMKWSMLGAVGVIAIACVVNMVYEIWWS